MPTPHLFQPARHNQLSFKLFAGVIVWLFFAIVATGYTLLLSWELENGGVAINDAGSLRKRTYQMVLLHNQQSTLEELKTEQTRFEHILNGLDSIGTHRFLIPNNQDIAPQVQLIRNYWQARMKPWLNETHPDNTIVTQQSIYQTDNFLIEINHLVKLIEQDNTKSIRLLRTFQMLLIGMAFLTAISGLYLLSRFVTQPLRRLHLGIERLSGGDLSTRLQVQTNDEFGLVADGFNQMATRLQDSHTHLEARVRNKTQALAQKNAELVNLYTVTAFLHQTHTLDEMIKGFTAHVCHISGATSAQIRLLNEPLELAHQSFAIDFQEQKLGTLQLNFANNQPLPPETQHLIETLCLQIGVAIENQRLIAQGQHFAVSEERNLMAQGLHDSIAQSLSFLNLQVQMLENAVINHHTDEALENLSFIKNGVQECYEDVRELLLNFRTRLSERDFVTSIQDLLMRFEQQTRIQTSLTVKGDGYILSPQQQLQTFFIVQEALSNVRKHAGAQKVWIEIEQSHDFILTVRDNGVGFTQTAHKDKHSAHVGTEIMFERATKINAQLNIDSQLGAGTVLSFILQAGV